VPSKIVLNNDVKPVPTKSNNDKDVKEQLPIQISSDKAVEQLPIKITSDKDANQQLPIQITSDKAANQQRPIQITSDKAANQQRPSILLTHSTIQKVPIDKASEQPNTRTASANRSANKLLPRAKTTFKTVSASSSSSSATRQEKETDQQLTVDDNAAISQQLPRSDNGDNQQPKENAPRNHQSQENKVAKTTFKVGVAVSSSSSSSSTWQEKETAGEIVSDWQVQNSNGGRPAYYLYSAYQVCIKKTFSLSILCILFNPNRHGLEVKITPFLKKIKIRVCDLS
jgi:hypothetical protein